MGFRRRAARKDTAHPEIARGLQLAGCSVLVLDVKDGPDLAVGHRGVTYLLEVKTPGGALEVLDKRRDGGRGKLYRRRTGKLSEGQQEWHAAWRGHRAVVYDLPDALQAVGFRVAPSYTPGTVRCEGDPECHRPCDAEFAASPPTCPFHRAGL